MHHTQLINWHERPLVLLDLDNTLWDFEGNAEKSLQNLFNYYAFYEYAGINSAEFVRIYKEINAKYWRLYESNLIDRETLRTIRFKECLDTIGIPAEKQPKNIAQEYLDQTSRMTGMVEGAFDLLDRLRKNHRVGLVTNGFQKTQETKVTTSGIGSHIDFMVTSETLGIAKPHKDIFEFALKTGNASAKETLYIGDHWDSDMVGAVGAGIDSIWFNQANAEAGKNLEGEGKLLLEVKNFKELINTYTI